jgi:hypothetical protein
MGFISDIAAPGYNGLRHPEMSGQHVLFSKTRTGFKHPGLKCSGINIKF